MDWAFPDPGNVRLDPDVVRLPRPPRDGRHGWRGRSERDDVGLFQGRVRKAIANVTFRRAAADCYSGTAPIAIITASKSVK